MRGAVADGATLVVLPEFFPMIGATDAARLAIRETAQGGPLQDWLSGLAAALKIWLVGGSIPMAGADPMRALNSTLVLILRGVRLVVTTRCTSLASRQALKRMTNR